MIEKYLKIMYVLILLLIIFFGCKFLIKEKESNEINKSEKENIDIQLSEKNKRNFNKVQKDGYEVSTTTLKIDYPIFIKHYNKKILEKIINKLSIESKEGSENPYSANLYKIIIIKNISGNDFNFLEEITSKIFFKEYNLNFINYNDNYYTLFKGINFGKIHDFTIHFNGKLEGKNTLEKTLNILSDKNRSYNYFSILSDKEFNNSYKMSKNNLDIFHKIDSYGLYATFDLSKEITDDYLINSFKKTSIGEYSLGKFGKGEGSDDKIGIKDEITGEIIEIE